MNKKVVLLLTLLLFIGLSSFNVHKFYVSIYQVDFVPEKKRVEITARIFLDDLNTALEQEYNAKMHLGEKAESAQDVLFLQKFLQKHLKIAIDGKERNIQFLSKEVENNVLIIYLKINDIKKMSAMKIQNNALLELNSDQQNIIQTNFFNKKKSYLFTGDYFVETIHFK
ncbi:DUF6702 family protein [Flavobacterium sp. SM2513]|uniref:DUF6702 family protein n=1 Tax=Flavobacterium sp. SM2513 TaxID=3424766 RepID=UPI003D7F7388